LEEIVNSKYRIGKSHISITSPQYAIESIENAVKEGISIYICVSDFRSICYAYSHPDYKKIMDASYLNLPDGMPLIWMARLWGIKDAHRTMGPQLFVDMLKKTNNGLKHFLIGDTDDNLDRIKSHYFKNNNSLIVGTFSPPFINVDKYDYVYMAKMINDSDADIVWVSMTAPKQEYFAVNIKPFLNKKVLIGVGAAFRYSLGLYNIPNGFIQKLGLTGFFMRKKSLWQMKWYIVHIVKLLVFSFQIIGRRINGKKYYE